MTRPRPRRTVLSVPATNERAVSKTRELAVDEVMLALEDSVAPARKADARLAAVAALTRPTTSGAIRSVRVNGWDSPWTYADVLAVLEQAGAALDAIVLPKVRNAGHVIALDLLLSQAERATGLPPGRIDIEAQIEDAQGLTAVDEIAAASPRVVALVYGPGDFMASLGMRSTTIGGQPQGYVGDAHAFATMRILVAARAAGLQAVDGPWALVHDLDGLRTAKTQTAALGYDGAWVVHPSQIGVVTDIFTPTQLEVQTAESILRAYDDAQTEGVGAVLAGATMIDEATRRQAMAVLARRV